MEKGIDLVQCFLRHAWVEGLYTGVATALWHHITHLA